MLLIFYLWDNANAIWLPSDLPFSNRLIQFKPFVFPAIKRDRAKIKLLLHAQVRLSSLYVERWKDQNYRVHPSFWFSLCAHCSIAILSTHGGSRSTNG